MGSRAWACTGSTYAIIPSRLERVPNLSFLAMNMPCLMPPHASLDAELWAREAYWGMARSRGGPVSFWRALESLRTRVARAAVRPSMMSSAALLPVRHCCSHALSVRIAASRSDLKAADAASWGLSSSTMPTRLRPKWWSMSSLSAAGCRLALQVPDSSARASVRGRPPCCKSAMTADTWHLLANDGGAWHRSPLPRRVVGGGSTPAPVAASLSASASSAPRALAASSGRKERTGKTGSGSPLPPSPPPAASLERWPSLCSRSCREPLLRAAGGGGSGDAAGGETGALRHRFSSRTARR